MAFIRVEPVPVQVRTDWFSGRPREVTWGAERLPITRLAVVREEVAAYPVISGPDRRLDIDAPDLGCPGVVLAATPPLAADPSGSGWARRYRARPGSDERRAVQHAS